MDFLTKLPWMQISIGNLIFCIAYFLFMLFSFLRFKEPQQASKNGSKNEFDPELRKTLVTGLQKAFATFNVKAISSITTEMMYYSTELTISALQKVGVRKEITLTPHTTPENTLQGNLMMDDGKNITTADVMYGSLDEKYVDNETDQVLYHRYWPEASYALNLIKSDQATLPKEKFCINCGAPIEKHGDHYDCPYCKSHYSSENYEWQISKLTVNNMKNDSIMGKFVFVLVASFMAVTVLAMIFPAMSIAALLVNLLLLGVTVSYCGWAAKQLHPCKTLQESDAKFSRVGIADRITYLYRLYEHAKDFNLSRLRPFMHPENFAKLKEGNDYDDNFYFLDCDVKNILFHEPYLKDGNQFLETQITAKTICRNQKKKLKVKNKQKIKMILYRKAGTQTPVNTGMQTITCPQCGANTNLTHDGKCRACGMAYDMSAFDWIIYDVKE